MINALLFISVCLNILAAMVIGVLIGKAEGRRKTPIEKILEEAMKKMADAEIAKMKTINGGKGPAKEV